MRPLLVALALGAAASSVSAAALAAPPGTDTVTPPPAPPPDPRDEVPVVGYAQNAFGASRMTAGTAGYVGVLYGQPNPTSQGPGKTLPQGGARLWGSPVDRLTLSLEVDRRDFSAPTPSATIAVRIFGSRAAGWAVGAAATYRAEGFANVVGEIEGSILASFSRYRLHADINAVFGGAFAEPEMDAEGKLRLGYDVTPWMRIGADSRFRTRVGNGKLLAGGRSVDGVGGPEIVFGYYHFFASVTGGPSTVGVAQGFGWSATTTVGGVVY